MQPQIRAHENFHIVLWLLKDLCWVMDLKIAGLVMIFPTLLLALQIAWKCRTDGGELLFSLAVVLWICANSTWMVGEFFFNDSLRPMATVFFIAGLFTAAWFYLVLSPRRRRARMAG